MQSRIDPHLEEITSSRTGPGPQVYMTTGGLDTGVV